MSTMQWNPWREFDDIFNRVASAAGENIAGSDWLPPVNISESDSAFLIEMDLPAVAAADVNVSIKDGVLTIAGERRHSAGSDSTGGDATAGKSRQHRIERRYGRFSRSFRLPENIDEQGINARSKDGVLYLTVAKKDKPEPRRIQIEVH